MKKTLLPLVLIFVLTLSACGGTEAVEEVASASGLNADYENALPVQLQLSIGTFSLEGTDLAVDAVQAEDLIPLWQVLNGLTKSGSAAPEEIDALILQIEETMTSEQTASIAAMQLTRENMGEIMQEYALTMSNGETPPEGMVPGQGRGGSDVPGLGGGGGGRNTTGMSPEQIATAQAERKAGTDGNAVNSRLAGAMAEGLIALLQSK